MAILYVCKKNLEWILLEIKLSLYCENSVDLKILTENLRLPAKFMTRDLTIQLKENKQTDKQTDSDTDLRTSQNTKACNVYRAKFPQGEFLYCGQTFRSTL